MEEAKQSERETETDAPSLVKRACVTPRPTTIVGANARAERGLRSHPALAKDRGREQSKAAVCRCAISLWQSSLFEGPPWEGGKSMIFGSCPGLRWRIDGAVTWDHSQFGFL